MQHKSLTLLLASGFLTACATNMPKPTQLPVSVTHQYKVTVKNQNGVPIEGLAMGLMTVDISPDAEGQQFSVPSKTTAITNKEGIVQTSLRVNLAQFWRGGYIDPDAEAEVARTIESGRRSAWGYLSRLQLTGPLVRQQTIFTQDKNDQRIDIELTLKTPDDYGKPGQHEYLYQVVDRHNRPVRGALVSAKLPVAAVTSAATDNGKIQCTTDLEGKCALVLPVLMRPIAPQSAAGGQRPHNATTFSYDTSLTATVTARGFSAAPDLAAISAKQASAQVTRKITLPTPLDYICPELNDPRNAKVTTALEKWAVPMVMAGLEREVRLNNLCVEQFKGNQYLTLGFDHSYTFNQAKLNQYGIGARIFDEVIRKILSSGTTMAEKLSLEGISANGYAFKIKAKSSNLADQASAPRILNYVFYLPRQLAKRYRESDVSGQQLINGSVVLLDGERIDLDLTR